MKLFYSCRQDELFCQVVEVWNRCTLTHVTLCVCCRSCWLVCQVSSSTMITARSCSTWQTTACKKFFRSCCSEQVRTGWKQRTLECRSRPRSVHRA